MRKRTPRLTEYPSYDSFLDFMTNVAGFLILLVVITPLGVSRAVQDIEAAAKQISPEDLQVAQEVEGQLLRRLEDLRVEWEAVQASREGRPTDSARLQEILKALEGEVAISTDRKSLSDERSALEAELERKRRELAERKKEYDSVAREEGMFEGWTGDRRSLKVPDPQKPREGMRRFEFLCRGNKICPFDMAELKKKFEDEAFDVGALVKTPTGITYKPEKGSELERRFSRKDIGNDLFRLTFDATLFSTPSGPMGLFLQYDLRPDAVLEDGASLQAAESRYREALKDLDPKAHWLFYFVYDDSFVAYYLARKVAEEMGFQAGWVAFSAGTQAEPETEQLRFPQLGGRGRVSAPD